MFRLLGDLQRALIPASNLVQAHTKYPSEIFLKCRIPSGILITIEETKLV